MDPHSLPIFPAKAVKHSFDASDFIQDRAVLNTKSCGSELPNYSGETVQDYNLFPYYAQYYVSGHLYHIMTGLYFKYSIAVRRCQPNTLSVPPAADLSSISGNIHYIRAEAYGKAPDGVR